jgi:hypothetical protein
MISCLIMQTYLLAMFSMEIGLAYVTLSQLYKGKQMKKFSMPSLLMTHQKEAAQQTEILKL